MTKKLRFTVIGFLISFIMIHTLYISAFSAEKTDESVTILFTHDMHDNFLPFELEDNGALINAGGYARLQSAINIEKEKNSNVLLLDAGDFSMGTPFQTIYKSDSPELRIMGEMGYEVVTLGNHEYDYRASGLAESLNAAKSSGDKLPQIVQSNVSFPADKDGNLTQTLTDLKQAMENYGVKDYTIIEQSGIKIGVFGIMGEGSASMAPMSEVEFENEIEQSKRVVKILKEQENVDLIICLSHSGTTEDSSKSPDEILAKKVPEINVIISGHTHTILSEPIIVGKTIIGSSGDNGKNLGVITISPEQDKSWKLEDYNLVQIDDSLQEDETISKQVVVYKDMVQNKYFDEFNLQYDEIIAEAPFGFQSIRNMFENHRESALANLITDAYLYAVEKAEGANYIPVTAAIAPAGTIRDTILKGGITTADAFSISSLGIGADNMPGYPLISVYLTGKELKTACEVDASVAPLMPDAQLFISGMNYTFNPNRFIFNKVVASSIHMPDGTTVEIEDKKLYRIIAGLYSAQMLSVVGEKSFGLLSIIPKAQDGTPVTDFEEHIIYNTSDGNKTEVKEWYAITEYLKSFETENGIPQIPEYYQDTQGRKIVDNNKNLLAIISKPNHITLAVYAIVTILIALITYVIVRIIRHKKRRRHIN